MTLSLSNGKTDYAHWKLNVSPLIADESPRVVNYPHGGYNAEHVSLVTEGDQLWRMLKAKANRLKSEL